jgi:hypothetical protein
MSAPRLDSSRHRRRLRPWVKEIFFYGPLVASLVLLAIGVNHVLTQRETDAQNLACEVASICREYCARTYGIGRPDLPSWVVAGENLPDLRGEAK